jgi:hypothetical protein
MPMATTLTSTFTSESTNVHKWLRKISIAYVPGPSTPVLDLVVDQLLNSFRSHQHEVLSKPKDQVDVLLTTARFGIPKNWRQAPFFTARRKYHLKNAPIVFTLLHATQGELNKVLDHFECALAKSPPDPTDFVFPGLTPQAFHTLYEQGRRGGPILSLVRLLQSQALSVRIILVVGEDHPLEAYTFDLVGAHPRSDAQDLDGFLEDIMLRIVTSASTHEVTEHEIGGSSISKKFWESLTAPAAMRKAGLELGKRKFFTEMVRVANLVSVPALHEAISSQYSEGCFATWDPQLQGLITTVTGSARPVVKDRLSDDELAVIVGVRANGSGAYVRLVEDKRNDPPSSEAVEMMQMDSQLPRIQLGAEWGFTVKPMDVPVARSKLHGHRGVSSYDSRYIEHVPLDPPYYYLPVSCSTEAQAHAIQTAFSRSQALNNPDDPRQVVFTVLPGHGVVIVEKWIRGKEPFQVIWEFIDEGRLVVDKLIPQGPLTYVPGSGQRQILKLLPPQD